VRDQSALQAFLDAAHVEPDVFALRPDYRALLIAVDGLQTRPGDNATEGLLTQAEAAARVMLATQAVEDIPHVAAWRDAYRGFGAKPQRTRNSLEALMRRADTGLPRINQLTDLYNALSVMHQIPIGGEDLDRYDGPPRLIRATGSEPFDTVVNGEPVTEYPDSGEVVWCDATGVTCRRWNWRQGRRTQLTEATTAALFILDALAPTDHAALDAVGDELAEHLAGFGSEVTIARRLIAPAPRDLPTPIRR
jgi:DNA/RNA-binding domain of Phe-tRNA-synthetase-like protein